MMSLRIFSRIVSSLLRKLALAGGLVLVTFILGCSGKSDLTDLQNYADGVSGKKTPPPNLLPEFKVFESEVYTSSGRRSPFAPPEVLEEQRQITMKQGPRPNMMRNREEMEFYPLESLKVVGTLRGTSGLWALIQAPLGFIHRVQVGNYIGQNYGKVAFIDESGVKITEFIPDGTGGWKKRPNFLPIVENN